MSNQTLTRRLLDIPELVVRLRDEKSRQKDLLVTQQNVKAVVADQPSVNASGDPVVRQEVVLAVEGHGEVALLEQAHGQVAGKLDIPARYYNRMKDGSAGDKLLAAMNVNHWLSKEPKKRRLVRLQDGVVRAWLGSRYRPISHLDVLTQAVMVVTGQEKEPGVNAVGARCYGWHLSPSRLDVSFVNPCMAVDLADLSKGVLTAGEDGFKAPEGPSGHGWLRGVIGDGGLFPAVRIRNSETGHGGLEVTGGLYEAICDNTAHLGVQMAQVHLGAELTGGKGLTWSEDTNRRMNEVIFSKVRDVVRTAFSPEALLSWSKRFKGLEQVELADVKEATAKLVSLAGLTEDVRDDILAAYYAGTQARANLFDLQRAVTGAAHLVREKDALKAAALEDLGGLVVAHGAKVLTAKKLAAV